MAAAAGAIAVDTGIAADMDTAADTDIAVAMADPTELPPAIEAELHLARLAAVAATTDTQAADMSAAAADSMVEPAAASMVAEAVASTAVVVDTDKP
jgi:hypothetical protein